jgi:hypothetical protein
MFILLMLILAYRHHRAGANGIATPARNLVTIARSRGGHRGPMGNRERYKTHWPATTRRTQCIEPSQRVPGSIKQRGHDPRQQD